MESREHCMKYIEAPKKANEKGDLNEYIQRDEFYQLPFNQIQELIDQGSFECEQIITILQKIKQFCPNQELNILKCIHFENDLDDIEVAKVLGQFEKVDLLKRIIEIFGPNSVEPDLGFEIDKANRTVLELKITDKLKRDFLGSCRRGETENVVKMLKENEMLAKVENLNGWTALHTATINQKHEIMEILLNHGADPNALTKNTMNMQSCLAHKGIDKEIELSPLHFAAALDDETAVKMLVKKGANRFQQSKNGINPERLATKQCVKHEIVGNN
jgi:hypothetical protein